MEIGQVLTFPASYGAAVQCFRVVGRIPVKEFEGPWLVSLETFMGEYSGIRVMTWEEMGSAKRLALKWAEEVKRARVS